jgi:hypothetical protein
MHRRGGRLSLISAAVVAAIALITGCGSSGSHPSSSPTTVVPASRPSSPPTTRAGGKAAPTSSDIAGLKQQLNAAASSLNGADTELTQTDPDQTRQSEGTTP